VKMKKVLTIHAWSVYAIRKVGPILIFV